MKRLTLSNVSKLFMSCAFLLSFALTCFAMPPEPEEEDFGQRPPKQEQNMKEDKSPNNDKMKAKFEKMLKELNITDEQKAKMDALRDSSKEKRDLIKKQIREKREAVNNELLKENFDKTVIDNLTNDIKKLSDDMIQMQIDGKIQIRNILTFEQFKKIEEDRAKMMQERKEKMNSFEKKEGKNPQKR